MRKKTTSRKREFSLSAIPRQKLRKDTRTLSIKSSARLKDQDLIFRALWQCLVDQDIESFKEILRSHLEVMNKSQLAKGSKISRRTLHRILSKDGNPTLENISKVIHALYG